MDNSAVEPRVVDAGRGAAWWAGGWRLFASNVFTWIGIIVVYYVISLAAQHRSGHRQHRAGAAHAGVHGRHRARLPRDRARRPLRVAHLFEGFQGAHFVPLMIIGAVNIGFCVALFVLVAAGVFGTVGIAALVNPRPMRRDPLEESARAMSRVRAARRAAHARRWSPCSRCSTGSRRRWSRCGARAHGRDEASFSPRFATGCRSSSTA